MRAKAQREETLEVKVCLAKSVLLSNNGGKYYSLRVIRELFGWSFILIIINSALIFPSICLDEPL